MTVEFTREDARQFYNHFGAKQDGQGFYEDAALDVLIQHGRFSDAESVFEIGCGTGRLAARLLSDHLPPSAHYTGIDISETMVGLTRERLQPWNERSEVHISCGNFDFSKFGRPFDRVVSTYVFDLLSVTDLEIALASAHAALKKGGLLCVSSVTTGTGFLSSATSTMWTWLHSLNPSVVGGCRPLVLVDSLPGPQWRILHREVVVSATVPSEVIVAERK